MTILTFIICKWTGSCEQTDLLPLKSTKHCTEILDKYKRHVYVSLNIYNIICNWSVSKGSRVTQGLPFKATHIMSSKNLQSSL